MKIILGRIKNLVIFTLVATLLLLFLNMFYECPFLKYLNIHCPGCGMTRATIALLHFNLIEAANYNFSVFFLAILGIVEVLQYLWYGWNGKRAFHKVILFAVLSLLLWVLRLF